MNEQTRRNSLRLHGYDYSREGPYFITICTKNSETMFGKIANGKMTLSEYGHIAATELLKSADIWNITVETYIIMPNHIHFIAKLERAAGTPPIQPSVTADRSKQRLPAMICRYKGAVTKSIGFSLWQRSYHDNIIHDAAGYKTIKHYIECNPTTWERDRFYCTE